MPLHARCKHRTTTLLIAVFRLACDASAIHRQRSNIKAGAFPANPHPDHFKALPTHENPQFTYGPLLKSQFSTSEANIPAARRSCSNSAKSGLRSFSLPADTVPSFMGLSPPCENTMRAATAFSPLTLLNPGNQKPALGPKFVSKDELECLCF